MRYVEIGAFDAKASLSKLLGEVRRGQRYTITLRGQPVADLIPSESAIHHNADLAIEAMQSIKRVKGVSAEALAQWISEGRE
jgi:prevent-host-death family protein